ncbi:MAG: hypothetical protein V3W41_03420 [Planctomycetota bacterium]
MPGECPRPVLVQKTEPSRRKSQFSTAVDGDQLEFIQAIEAFKKEHKRAFPSWSEVLQVLKGLGYAKPES